MPSETPNDILERKTREKHLRATAAGLSAAERQAKFFSQVETTFKDLQDGLPKRVREPLSVAFTKGTPHDADGGFGMAAFDFALCYEGKRFSTGTVNVTDNGKVEFYDRTGALHEHAVRMAFEELTEDAVVDFMGRLTQRHLVV